MKLLNEFVKKIQKIIGGSSSHDSHSRFNETNTCAISFSFSEGIAAQYLNLVLKSLNIESYLYNRSTESNPPFGLNIIRFRFLIIPSKYHDLLGTESCALENEVRWIVHNDPKCCIIFIQTPECLDNKRVEELVSSTRRVSQSSVDIITFSIHDSFFNFTQKVVGRIMPLTGSDSVAKIQKPFEELVYVRKDSLFSDLFYKMDTLGVRHCPVIDPKTHECFRIISRRDLVKLVPPGNLLIPQEVQDKTGITISPRQLINLVDELGEKTIGELFKDQKLVSISSTENISKAVELLSIRHPLGGNNSYISGLPVIDKTSERDKGKLVGFISYTDVLRNFISKQDAYLLSTVEQVATMETDNDPLWKLHESQYLRDAVIRLKNVRSLPVVDKHGSDKLVGFVEDVQVMAYNHPTFAEELGTLGVKYFMTPVKDLYTPMPGDVLKSCINKFCESSSGMYPPSTLAVCNTQNGDNKRLKGVISYVDILSEWRKFPAQAEE